MFLCVIVIVICFFINNIYYYRFGALRIPSSWPLTSVCILCLRMCWAPWQNTLVLADPGSIVLSSVGVSPLPGKDPLAVFGGSIADWLHAGLSKYHHYYSPGTNPSFPLNYCDGVQAPSLSSLLPFFLSCCVVLTFIKTKCRGCAKHETAGENKLQKQTEWRWRVSIPLPNACKAFALPCELHPPSSFSFRKK